MLDGSSKPQSMGTARPKSPSREVSKTAPESGQPTELLRKVKPLPARAGGVEGVQNTLNILGKQNGGIFGNLGNEMHQDPTSMMGKIKSIDLHDVQKSNTSDEKHKKVERGTPTHIDSDDISTLFQQLGISDEEKSQSDVGSLLCKYYYELADDKQRLIAQFYRSLSRDEAKRKGVITESEIKRYNDLQSRIGTWSEEERHFCWNFAMKDDLIGRDRAEDKGKKRSHPGSPETSPWTGTHRSTKTPPGIRFKRRKSRFETML
jgi:hypothetical protein